jgi:hypothetical protein
VRAKTNSRGWNLYWVVSDGADDCFIVARSSRSARRIERDDAGWDDSEVSARKVLSIPHQIELAYSRRLSKKKSAHAWPNYADDWLLSKLGAATRDREGLLETLLDGVVYTRGSDGPTPPRSVGSRAVRELKNHPVLGQYGEEDNWTRQQEVLLTLMGVCLARCQEIEHLLANSFIFALGDNRRRAYKTIGEMQRAWKRKTLGALFRIVEQGYEIEPIVHRSLRGFIDMRNHFVHSLTTDDRTTIHDKWGQDEMIAFLALFEIYSRGVRKAFLSSLYASVEYGLKYMVSTDSHALSLTKKQRQEAALFSAFFKPRVSEKSPASG